MTAIAVAPLVGFDLAMCCDVAPALLRGMLGL